VASEPSGYPASLFRSPELSGIFAFAGLWERWGDRAAGQTLETCTILTTSPNSLVAGVHDRMPVILKTEDYDLWLDPASQMWPALVTAYDPLTQG
jgi:putative SOS response-associated peptidase YedK